VPQKFEEPEPARAAKDAIKPGQEGFLTEGFKRYMAAKESGGTDPEPPAREWSAAEALPQTEDENKSGVETVLRLFNGTIVKNGMET
jgi:hypothetical protein